MTPFSAEIVAPRRDRVFPAPARGGARLRRLLWRVAFRLTGGLRVYGGIPAGPCVVVANHRSHADTPALLAALPATNSPRVAASPAYWFTRPWRSRICRWLAGAFPLARGEEGLARAESLLAAGHLVIVYPEGTRSRDGALAPFRPGAARLAARAGVPLVPAGITGSGGLLPVHGHLRRHPVTVRFGTPTHDLEEARRAVADLSQTPETARTAAPTTAAPTTDVPPVAGVDAETPDSALRRRIAAFAHSRTGLLAVFLWAVAEALFWPLIPEFALAIVCVAAPRSARRLAPAAAVGTLCGGVLMYLLSAHGVHLPQLLTTARMHAFLNEQIAQFGPQGLRHQAFNGIPFKVYGATAGENHLGLIPFLLNTLPGRFIRIIAIGLAFGALGAALNRLRRWYPYYLAVFLILFTLGLSGVIRHWS
ncbi:lysophospholipid acyltransferase family protein [Actinoplanes sp. NPDC051851]|uniref:lysophospholipid acyltransferase family protein n=1 Tax=Actinoplanes sp. NPDC051851 TaxID=3154753 RepID=UPI00343495D3